MRLYPLSANEHFRLSAHVEQCGLVMTANFKAGKHKARLLASQGFVRASYFPKPCRN